MKSLPLTHLRCVMCATETERIDPHEQGDRPNTDCCFRQAGVVSFSFGYGSHHDTTHVYGIICDTCALLFAEQASASLHGFSCLGNLPTKWGDTIQVDPEEDEEGL